MSVSAEVCPTCHGRGVIGATGQGRDGHEPCVDEWHLSHGSQLEREVAAFVAAQRRTDETLASGEAIADEAEHKLASLTGTPEGIGPRVNPDCPICTNGRGLPCSWHSLS